jgi:transposase
LSTKINAVVDENGLPVRLLLTAGQAHDLRAAPQLLAGLKCRHVVADRGYDADALLDLIRAAGAKLHIPSTSQRIVHRSVNRRIYRQRNLVERFFCKLKHFRRVATRFDKLARNFLAAVALASARLWMRAYESTT